MWEPFDQPVALPIQDTPSSPVTIPIREPFGPHGSHPLTSFGAHKAADRTANSGSQTQHQSFGLNVYHRSSPSMSVLSCKQPRQQSRYYAQALSAEDRLALLQGKEDDSLQDWLGESANTHDRPGDLVPRVMPKVERTNALTTMEDDKQHSQRALSKLTKKVRKFFGLSQVQTKIASIDAKKDEESAYSESRRVSCHSTYNFRSSTLSPPEPSPLPESKSTPSFQEFVNNAPRYHGSHARAASSEDYFSQHSNSRISTCNANCTSSLASNSGPPSSSDTSTRVRSPLLQEVKFRANPETTFDSLLAPHKSGKGEVLKDSKYAQKVKTPKASPNLNAKTKRLTKMHSIPLLLRRGSRTEGGVGLDSRADYVYDLATTS
ncbi:hypothetical protein AA0121_g11960 [Alternaria tenuissima]|nr:hypothetical protein AA0121_g11960 [Alternaria tenuissima]